MTAGIDVEQFRSQYLSLLGEVGNLPFLDDVEIDPGTITNLAREHAQRMQLPSAWLDHVNTGVNVMSRDGRLTLEEVLAVIDMASKVTLLDNSERDFTATDTLSFEELMENERLLIANEKILRENAADLQRNQERLDRGDFSQSAPALRQLHSF